MVALLDVLAPELLIKIVEHANTLPTPSCTSMPSPIAALASTCRVLRHLALPLLFSSLTIRVPHRPVSGSKAHILSLYRGISNHPRIPGCIGVLTLLGADECVPSPSTHRAPHATEGEPPYLDRDTASAIAKLIVRLPRLISFSVATLSGTTPFNVLPVLVHALVCAPNLERISLHRVHCFPAFYPPDRRPSSPPPMVKSVDERGVSLEFEGCWPSALSVVDAFIHSAPRRGSAATSLSIVSHVNTFGSSTAGFDPALWGQLRRLDVGGFMIEQTKELVLLSLASAKAHFATASLPLESLTISDPLSIPILLRLLDILSHTSSPLNTLDIVLKAASYEEFDSLIATIAEQSSFPSLRRLGLFRASRRRRAVMPSTNPEWPLHAESLSLLRHITAFKTNLAPSTSEETRLVSCHELFSLLRDLEVLRLPIIDGHGKGRDKKSVDYRAYER